MDQPIFAPISLPTSRTKKTPFQIDSTQKYISIMKLNPVKSEKLKLQTHHLGIRLKTIAQFNEKLIGKSSERKNGIKRKWFETILKGIL